VRFQGRDLNATIGQSFLEIAEANEIDLDHACGGVCACSTCHVKVLAGADALNEASEDEEDQLDEARDVDLSSRLGCQARIVRPPEGGVIEVEIPAWNVNLVKEAH
jgi:2Fe-2S ferredoxin